MGGRFANIHKAIVYENTHTQDIDIFLLYHNTFQDHLGCDNKSVVRILEPVKILEPLDKLIFRRKAIIAILPEWSKGVDLRPTVYNAWVRKISK